jgi:hypothetical protein
MIKTIGSIPAEKLLGMEIDLFSKLRSGALTIHQFDLFLKKQNPFTIPPFLKLGTFGTFGELNQAISDAGGEVPKRAWDLMLRPEFTLAEVVTEIKLVTVTAGELGFQSSATRDEIYERATSKDFNYTLCPPEVGPQLRLQYLNQPHGEDVAIGMEPIKLHRTTLGVIFAVSNLTDTRPPQLNVYDGQGERVWEKTDIWVFQNPN